ncbi:hypothetical protein PIB30_069469, partial [Stylosanthes scabra]|nr:hypothetical protein [Stylosanthes scabra]
AYGVLRAAGRVLRWLDLHGGGWIWTLEWRLVDDEEAGEAGGRRDGWTTMRTLLHDDVTAAAQRHERVRSVVAVPSLYRRRRWWRLLGFRFQWVSG